jgi:hypothetical protein
MPVVLFVLVLEGKYWDVVDIRSRIPAFQLPKKAIELNRFRRFEYEYEYRKAEYEKAGLLPTKIPEQPIFELCALCDSVFQERDLETHD